LGFFGLKQENRKEIHEQIFQLIYHGGGGFNHADVYNMPTYLRIFYYNELVKSKKAESEQIKKANQKSKLTNPRFKR
jgi:hypothetical protein